jgi:predicted HTH transcriptional regulator
MLYRMDLVEHVGSGLKRIRGAMKEYGLEVPVIEAAWARRAEMPSGEAVVEFR